MKEPRKNDRQDLPFDPARGFLDSEDPLRRLPPAFAPWEETAINLPKLLVADRVAAALEALPPFPVNKLTSDREFERAMVILSFLGHAYVLGGREPRPRLPARLAVPWHEVAKYLGRPPVLSYASYALHNWRRFDPEGPVALGNIVMLQNFLGGLDEEWFVLVHVDIEAKAAPAIAALLPAQAAVKKGDNCALTKYLGAIACSLEEVCRTMDRMPENCDPYIYYNRVRPYIHGWKDNPGLPDGIIYEGVKELGGLPQKFRGETGAQSGIIPTLDGALGITHQEDPLRVYLMEIREYMPRGHRRFLETVEQGPSIRDYVIAQHENHPALREKYNACVGLVERFRTRHFEYAARYIQMQSQKSALNPTKVGTGGTPFMVYLDKHKGETSGSLIQ
jgi:indoleamine 2,3-dioxygenase